MRLKRPAARNIGLDLDPDVIRRFETAAKQPGGIAANAHGGLAIAHRRDRLAYTAADISENAGGATFDFRCSDAIAFLRAFRFTGGELVYCDPPYMHETRGRSNLYRFEMSDGQHRKLLRVLLSLPCFVMVSGYWTRLYADMLAGWQSFTFQTVNRAGRPTCEWVWSNFAEPLALHDYRYLGRTFRERERIKRKKLRWVRRLRSMPVLERRALLDAIADAWAAPL